MTRKQYLALKSAAQRAEQLRACLTLAEIAYRDLMEAHGFDSTKPYRWRDDAFDLEDPHGDATGNG